LRGRGMNGRPPHHGKRGYINPWPTFSMPTRADLLRWQQERRAATLPPNPGAAQFPARSSKTPARRAPRTELAATWIGHSTWLLQVGGVNILTDPHWSERASPVRWAGPRRLTRPGLPFESLPPIDVVLLSHDHYDHLDEGTVSRLNLRYGKALR